MYWSNAVICSVLGANPPYDVIKGFINRIWAAFEIDKIIQVKRGVFLVRFVNLQDKVTVEKRGLYFFDAKPFLVKGWNPQMDLQTESIRSLPIWIQMSDLDIKFWGNGSLSKLGSYLGIPLKTDKHTKDRTMLRYARMLVDIPLEGPFPDHIEFFDESGTLIRQRVYYEWKPLHCSHCHMFGHEIVNCRKKVTVRKEWRPVTNEATGVLDVQCEPPNVLQIVETSDEFTFIPPRAAAKHTRPPVVPVNHTTRNQFAALEGVDKEDLLTNVVGPLHNG